MEIMLLLLVSFVLAALLIQGAVEVSAWIVNKVHRHRANKRARIEAELDRKQAELRAAIYSLASQLGAEAHEARKALIRESYLASRDEFLPPR
ncbi:hypothetical protein GCM10022239_08590 [Leifsonia bigeumensis]|uniref:Uncharacterized protein n=1 Tax=Leifsonella bigeumensis TaxID=433643 RepID=A0ABP7FAL6_9MICO